MKITRKITTFALATLIGGTCFSASLNHALAEPVSVSSAVYDEVPEGYTGIYTIDDLYAVRNNLSGKYILMNDVDLSATAPGGDWDSGNGWLPIDNFKGIFDGNGYAIKNMHIYGELSSNMCDIGLFGYCLDDSEIIQLAIVNCDIDCKINNDKETYIGAVAGKVERTSGIERCYVSGNIKITTDKSDCYIGGICGGCTIKNIVTNSFNTANVEVNIITDTSEDIENIYIGGLVGMGSSYNVYNAGNITVNVEGDGNAYGEVGNIIGYYYNFGQAKNTYYLKTLNNYSAFGNEDDDDGSALTVGQMKSSAAFTGFDFDEVWTIDPNAEYPYPTLKNVPYVASSSFGNSGNSGSSGDSGNSGNTGNTNPTLMGDMNGDGMVDAIDATYILQYYAYASTGGTLLPDEYFRSLN